MGDERASVVVSQVAQAGLPVDNSGRISARVSPRLIEQAKARTGLRSDADLIAFALANVARDDVFWETFDAVKGSVDPELDIEF